MVEQCGLHVVDKMCQGLLGIRCTGTGGAAELLEPMDFVVTLPAPLLIDGALGLRLALFRGDKDLAGVYGALQCKTSEVSQPQGVEGSKAVLPY
jgi:hypothetical protein